MGVRLRLLAVLCSSLLIAIFLAVLLRSSALATPDYARQTGEPCGTCHTRPEGGGELTPVGVAFARGGYQWPISEEPEVYTPSNLARVLRFIARYIHLTVTVIWFGTIFYIAIVTKPQQLTTGVSKEEGIIAWISIPIMLLTGIMLTTFRYLETGSVFAGTFGTVFIIKLLQAAVMGILALMATVPLTRRLRRGRRPLATPPSAPAEVTLETLCSFDGKDGRRAIVAVGGKFYDVTDSGAWEDGIHMTSHQAGEDLTEELSDAPHGEEMLDNVPMISELTPVPGKAEVRRLPAQRVFVVLAYINLALIFGILLCVTWWKAGLS